MTTDAFDKLLKDIRACRHCTDLPLGPNPMIRASEKSRIIIIGQAPGTKVHASGIPWNDPSGNRLRDWLGVGRDSFYNAENFTLMPMGLCYPGRLEKGGDKPPQKECAPKWHEAVLAHLNTHRLTLLVGSYAQAYYLKARQKNMTETVRHWRDYEDQKLIPLPHPSWRVTNLIRKNPWFEAELVPALQEQVRKALTD